MNYIEKTKDELIHELLLLKAENENLKSASKMNNNESIIHSELRYERFFEDNHSTMLLVNPQNGDIVDANSAANQYYGWTRDEMQKMHISDINTLSPEEVKIEMQKSITDKRRQFYFRHRLANDEIRDVEVYSGPIKFGNRTLLYSIVHDISERKKIEAKLIQSEERYAKAFLTASYGVIISRAEDGKLIEVNDSFCSITGYSREEALKNTSESLGLWYDRADRNKVVEALKESGRFSEMEMRFRKKNGELIIGAMSTTIVNINNEKCLFSSINDITERKLAEEKLRISEERYRNIFENVQDAYYEASPDGILLDISPAIETISRGQFTRNEVIGKSFVGLYADPEARARFYEHLVSQGKVLDYELSLLNKDGTVVPVAVSTTLIKDLDGNPVKITGSMRDISERKRNEKLLQESEALYFSVLNASPDDITIADLEGKVLYVSPKALSMFRYEYENQIIGRNLLEFIAPEDQQKGKAGTDSMLKGNPIGTTEYKAIRSDNSVFDVEVNGEFIRDAEGKTVSAVYIVRDISERKLTEEKLTQSEEKYRLLFAHNPQPMWIYDLETLAILEVNDSSIQQYGYTREEFLNLTIKDIRPAEDIQELIEDVNSAEKNKNARKVWRHSWKDGTLRYVEITAQSIDFNGRNARHVLINDVTERVQAEDALRQSEEKYKSIIESQSEGIGLVDENEIFRFVNPAALRIFETENLIGASLFDFLSPFEIKKINEQTNNRKNGVSNNYELEIITPKGNVKFISVSTEPNFDENGLYEGAYGVFMDITERKLAQIALMQSEEKYRKDLILLNSIFESPVNIIVFSLDKNYCYTAFTTYHALTMKQIWGVDIHLGMNMLELISNSGDREKAKTNFDKALSGENFVLIEEYGDDSMYSTYYENFYSPVKNTSNEITGISIFVIDATERLQATKRLEISEERFSQVVELSKEIVWEVNKDGLFTYASPHAKDVYGYNPDQMIAKMHFYDLIPEENREVLKKRVFEIFETKSSFRNIYSEIIKSDGSRSIVLTSGLPVFNQNAELKGYRGVDIDITDRVKAETNLSLSEAKFRAITEQTSDFIALTDKNGFITYASSSSSIIFRLSPEEMIGCNFIQFVGKADLNHSENGFRNIVEKAVIIKNSVSLMKRSNGEEFYGELNGSKFINENQEGVLVTIRDITERINAEKEIIKFKTISDQANYGVIITSLDGDFIYVNDAFAKMVGWEADDLIGKNSSVVRNEEQSERVTEILALIISKKGFKSEELYHNRKDGSSFPTLMSSKVIFDENNVAQYLSATIIDITESKRKEDELIKIYKAVEQSPVMTVITDLEGNIEYHNEAVTKITGYSKDEIIGRNPRLFSSGETPKEDFQQLWATISSGHEWQGEFHNKKKNGELFWTGVLITPILDSDGKLTHYVSVEEDITQRKQNERELLELNSNLEDKVNERTIKLNEARLKLENELIERIEIENDLRWNKSLLELMSNSSPLGFLVVDNRTDNILYFNKRFCKIWEIEQLAEKMQRGELKNNDIIPYCLPILEDIPAFAESCEPLQDEHNRLVLEDEIAFTNNRTIRRFSTQIRGENDEYFGRFYIFEDISVRKQAEAALQESQEQFKLFMNYLPALVFIKDNQSKMIYANNAMDTGLGVSGWINKSLFDTFDRETAERIIEDDRKTIQQGYQLIEESFTNLDGNLHNYETQKFAIPRVGKEPLLGGISIDITERKKTEVLIAQTKENYETFFNTIDDFLFVLDKQGNIIHINNTVYERLEFSREELIEKSVLLVHPPERRDEAGRIVGEMLAGTAEFCPVPLITKSGNKIPVETRVKSGFWDGKPVIFGVSKDVSKIQFSEEKFSKAFNSNSACMAINSSDDGAFIDVNDAFVSTMGYSREELIGKTTLEVDLFERKEDRESIYALLNNHSIVKDLEYNVTKKTGELITGLFSAEQIFVGDKPCLLSLFVDITKRKQAEEALKIAIEEAEKANMAKSEFLSRMSHELRTPLNSILGFAQLLEMTELAQNQQKGVEHILHSGKHLLSMINEVLDIARIESGHISISLEPVKLSGVYQEMLDVMQPLAVNKNVSLRLVECVENQFFVKADRQSLKQILLNLLNNAIKYNKPEGLVTIETNYISENNVVRILVSDTGHGISEENIKKLFIPFERVGADKTDIEGTGLGLSVVKKLVEAMGGSVSVNSKVGIGSTFIVELPEAEDLNYRTERTGLQSAATRLIEVNKGTILYIEDNESNIELVQQILNYQSIGINLISDKNGNNAVRLAAEVQPDLILLDLNLPDLHGSEVIKLLLADKRTMNIPVIILSADAMSNQIENLMQKGARGYLTKPLEVNELVRIVNKYLK